MLKRAPVFKTIVECAQPCQRFVVIVEDMIGQCKDSGDPDDAIRLIACKRLSTRIAVLEGARSDDDVRDFGKGQARVAKMTYRCCGQAPLDRSSEINIRLRKHIDAPGFCRSSHRLNAPLSPLCHSSEWQNVCWASLVTSSIAEKARIEHERFHWAKGDATELRMCWIEQPIVLAGGDRRGHNQQGSRSVANEVIAKGGKVRRSWPGSPVNAQFVCGKRQRGEIIRDSCRREHEIVWGIFRIEMGEILDHRQGEVLGSVGDARAWRRPAATIAVSAFSIEGGSGKCSAEKSVYLGQLTPP